MGELLVSCLKDVAPSEWTRLEEILLIVERLLLLVSQLAKGVVEAVIVDKLRTRT